MAADRVATLSPMPDLSFSRRPTHKRRRRIAAAALVLVAGALLATYLVLRSSDDDVRKGEQVEKHPALGAAYIAAGEMTGTKT